MTNTAKKFFYCAQHFLFLTVVIFVISFQNLFCETITFSADSMMGKAKKDENLTKLSGNAFAKTSSIQVSSDFIELSGKDFRFVNANGNIKGTYSDAALEFECSELNYDRETKIVTLSGAVRLKDTEHDVTAEAQLVEYNQNTDIAILQIDVVLHQKENVCSGSYAIYRKAEQKLELNGGAKVTSGSDTFRAQTISFDMETEEIIMDGNVHGKVVDDGSNSNDKKIDSSQKSKENDTTKVKANDRD